MYKPVTLTEGETVRIAADAFEVETNESLESLAGIDFTVVAFDGHFGRKEPVRVTVADAKGIEYRVLSSKVIQQF